MDSRYSRQALFPEIGKEGQEKLARSAVGLIGCGALGSAHAEMLSRAGVGKLKIVDRDFVEFSNLQRQTLFRESDAAGHMPKAVAAKIRIAEINSDVIVDPHITDVNNSNIESLINDCDLILDGTDNFQVRYLLNDACVKQDRMWIYGAAVSSYGTTMTILPGRTPCLRCIFDEIPDAGSSPTCDTAGVIMPIIATIAAAQVTEALKILIGDLDALHGSLLQFDVWQSDVQKIRLGAPDPECPACGKHNYEFLEADAGDFAAVLCGRNAVQISPGKAAALDLDRLADELKAVGDIKQNEYLLRFNSDHYEITVFGDARAIIRGTDDITVARSLYARFIGN